MKGFLILWMFLIASISYSQTNLKKEIEKLPISQHRGCDTIEHKKIEGFVLGELPIKIEIESAYQKDQKLKIIGIVKTIDSNEPLPNCIIWTATFDTNYCKLYKLLAVTDPLGNFNIEFENAKNLSLFFWSLSYVGYEIKIGKLIK
jgi:hypothetical protein